MTSTLPVTSLNDKHFASDIIKWRPEGSEWVKEIRRKEGEEKKDAVVSKTDEPQLDWVIRSLRTGNKRKPASDTDG